MGLRLQASSCVRGGPCRDREAKAWVDSMSILKDRRRSLLQGIGARGAWAAYAEASGAHAKHSWTRTPVLYRYE